ncbi:hypothetical protein GHT06_017078 [Daphnia sinensis]|uniref:Uncharacterized protein n=1 Tax=Daphnia sinensis TaxID=1820382 RepID=A0AAD5L8H5_9CRUS|nr:hypothetical protein GHT06_017078 [Daphnia sinensis]
MTLDAIVKLNPENEYLKGSTNKKEESYHAANANPDIAENPRDRNYDKDVKDDDDKDNEKVASQPVTIDKNQKLLPINQHSTVRKRQATCRLSLEVSHQTNDYEDLLTSKKVIKPTGDTRAQRHTARQGHVIAFPQPESAELVAERARATGNTREGTYPRTDGLPAFISIVFIVAKAQWGALVPYRFRHIHEMHVCTDVVCSWL